MRRFDMRSFLYMILYSLTIFITIKFSMSGEEIFFTFGLPMIFLGFYLAIGILEDILRELKRKA